MEETVSKRYQITGAELEERLRALGTVFDIVRIVNVSTTKEITFHGDGTRTEASAACFHSWNKDCRCINCISARAFSQKGRSSKMEFINDEVYFVLAQYLEVDGEPCIMEGVYHLQEDTIVGAYGRSELVDRITRFNGDLYLDSLTGARNRNYYDAQLSGLYCEGVAMVDVDHFKQINDHFGHPAGDQALKAVVSAIQSCVRKTDITVRYGGDEFVVCFEQIPAEEFSRKLEAIRSSVREKQLQEFPELQLSVSIGGVYGRGTSEQMLAAADRAMYVSKQQRNTVTIQAYSGCCITPCQI